MEETKYFTKKLLIEYNNAAIRERRNRAIKEDFLENLPEDYVYPVVFMFYHTKNEVRVEIDFFDDGCAFLDMSVARYDMLPIAKWNDETQELLLEDENSIKSKFPYKNREWTEKIVRKPYRKQDKFRKDILKAYNNTCAVCGIKEPKVLIAAHIVDVTKGGIDNIKNGICLCANHSSAFDKGILKIRPDGTIEAKSKELGMIFDRILYPNDKKDYPSQKFLEEKYKME